jgi:hypothetical protein
LHPDYIRLCSFANSVNIYKTRLAKEKGIVRLLSITVQIYLQVELSNSITYINEYHSFQTTALFALPCCFFVNVFSGMRTLRPHQVSANILCGLYSRM